MFLEIVLRHRAQTVTLNRTAAICPFQKLGTGRSIFEWVFSLTRSRLSVASAARDRLLYPRASALAPSVIRQVHNLSGLRYCIVKYS